MASCCTSSGTDRFFSRAALRHARQFRRKGGDQPSRILVSELVRLGIGSQSILDIGCGVGGVHLSLLSHGAKSAQGVDMSSGMLREAEQLARYFGFTDRVSYHHGDFLELHSSLQAADAVILDKVVCCYSDPGSLLSAAASLGKKTIALSYPRDAVFPRLGFRTLHALGRLLAWSFHPFFHEPHIIDEHIRRQGFVEESSRCTLIWQMKVFVRPDGVPG